MEDSSSRFSFLLMLIIWHISNNQLCALPPTLVW